MTKSTVNYSPKALAKRQAILEAALDNFIANGFALSRIEDIAKAAHVAKGTVYLYFTDKNALFTEAIRTAVTPFFVATKEQMGNSKGSGKERMLQILEKIMHSLLHSKMHHILRLLISEGLRFPDLVAFYYQDFLAPHFDIFEDILAQAQVNNELTLPTVRDYPHLITAPIITGLIWHVLFGNISPIDTKGLVETQVSLMFKG